MYNNTINDLRKPSIISNLLNKKNNYTKLFLLASYFILNTFSQVYAQNETSTLLDERDGKVYKTVKIGTQWWMAENLNIGTKVNGSTYGLFQKNNGIIEKYFYKDDDKNGGIYGGLYDWEEAMNYAEPSDKVPSGVQGICPCGWHIPSDEEWKNLERYLGMPEEHLDQINGERGSIEADKIKESGNEHWIDFVESYGTVKNQGNNETGFTALPAGNRHNYALIWGNQGVSTVFWSSSAKLDEGSKLKPFIRHLQSNFSNLGRSYEDNSDAMKLSISVRCVKDPETTTSVNEVNTKVRIYPNPASDYVIIQNASASSYYNVYNIHGDKIIEIDNKLKNNTLRIDISKLEKGVYYLSGFDINVSFIKY